jgi:hypothetical protein
VAIRRRPVIKIDHSAAAVVKAGKPLSALRARLSVMPFEGAMVESRRQRWLDDRKVG